MLFFVTFCLLFSTEFSSALESPLWVIQRKRDLYERNSVCMESKRKKIEEYGALPIQTIVAQVNTTIWLKCFDCLHPDDAEELEDVWKPSSSVIGRKIQQFLRKIREKIIRSHSGVSEFRRGNLSDYRWQWFNEGEWMDKKGLFDEKNMTIFNVVEKVMSKENDGTTEHLYIGDHFELEIRNIDVAKEGWYRCVNTTGSTMDVSAIYHVTVLDDFRTVMFSTDQMPEEMKRVDFTKRMITESPSLELFWRESEWTSCNKCGDRVGEQRRVRSCYLKRKWSINDNHPYYEVFTLLGELPCHSSLVPRELRSKLSENLTMYEEFAECRKQCLPSEQNSNETRKVTINETGREEVLDVLPPGEFSTNERLPPLAPPIIRKTIFLTEGDWLTMDCSNQDAAALIWRKDSVELNATRIFSMEDGKERQRRVITSSGMFVIRSARLEDAGLYSCTAYPSGHILRTFLLFTDIGDRSAEVLAAVSIFLRTLLILFLLLLLFNVLNVKVPYV